MAKGTARAGALRGGQACAAEGLEEGLDTPIQGVRSSLGGQKRDREESGPNRPLRPQRELWILF